MFGETAIQLLKLMGHSGTVPSAILPEDIPRAVKRLREGLEVELTTGAEEVSRDGESQADEPKVSLKTRAFPLIQLLEAAAQGDEPVTWES